MIQKIDQLQSPDFKRKISQCIHCGLCLQSCPTYRIIGTEMDSPRGRILLMRIASEDRISDVDFKEAFSQHISLCLACLSCETACPSGVHYGELIEQARFIVEENRQPGIPERFLRWFGTKQLMVKPGLLLIATRLLSVYQKIGLQRIIRSINILPKSLKAMEDMLPPLNSQQTKRGVIFPALGIKRGEVAFFIGCIQEGFLPKVNLATIRVLQRNGFEVHTPSTQTCCGAAQLHLGDREFARKLARQNIDTFLKLEGAVDAIICNAGGCGLALKQYPHLLADDPIYFARARHFSALVKDVNEFLVENLHNPPQGDLKVKATYADSCHLRHGQRIVNQPRQLLKAIPGLQLVELATPDLCCGSAGVYNIAHADTASEILRSKMDDIKSTGADIIATSNTGCQLQLITGARHAGIDARVLHVVEVLDLSYTSQEENPDRVR